MVLFKLYLILMVYCN